MGGFMRKLWSCEFANVPICRFADFADNAGSVTGFADALMC
jgi:hypothetical protein